MWKRFKRWLAAIRDAGFVRSDVALALSRAQGTADSGLKMAQETSTNLNRLSQSHTTFVEAVDACEGCGVIVLANHHQVAHIETDGDGKRRVACVRCKNSLIRRGLIQKSMPVKNQGSTKEVH